ncbi:zinc finger MYM-type protein 1-like protein [Tanacetum coccineum]
MPSLLHQLLEKNEHYIRLCCSIDVVRFLLRQVLSFRGHDETEESHNKGNFLELLRWLGYRCDLAWRATLKKALKNGKMTCGKIQKDIARAFADEIINAIKVEFGDDLFAILVDESRDVSCKEQMALVLRFVNKKGEVVERLIGVKKLEGYCRFALKNSVCAEL